MGLRRTAAAEPLREVVERAHPRDLTGLLEQLCEGSAEQRRWAARDLAAHPGCTAALGAQLRTERDAAVRDALLTTLGSLGSPDAAAALLPLLRSEDARLRNGAIEVLARMPAAVAPNVPALLRDADADVRIFTVNLLGDLQHARVLPWLLDVLAQDSAVNVVAAALEVIAEVGGPEQLPALRAAQARFADDPFIGFAVEIAIGRIESA